MDTGRDTDPFSVANFGTRFESDFYQMNRKFVPIIMTGDLFLADPLAEMISLLQARASRQKYRSFTVNERCKHFCVG